MDCEAVKLRGVRALRQPCNSAAPATRKEQNTEVAAGQADQRAYVTGVSICYFVAGLRSGSVAARPRQRGWTSKANCVCH
jgi:hypothetical protein